MYHTHYSHVAIFTTENSLGKLKKILVECVVSCGLLHTNGGYTDKFLFVCKYSEQIRFIWILNLDNVVCYPTTRKPVEHKRPKFSE